MLCKIALANVKIGNARQQQQNPCNLEIFLCSDRRELDDVNLTLESQHSDEAGAI